MRRCDLTDADLLLDGVPYAVTSLDELRALRLALADRRGQQWVDWNATVRRLHDAAPLAVRVRWERAREKQPVLLGRA